MRASMEITYAQTPARPLAFNRDQRLIRTDICIASLIFSFFFFFFHFLFFAFHEDSCSARAQYTRQLPRLGNAFDGVVIVWWGSSVGGAGQDGMIMIYKWCYFGDPKFERK